MASIASFCARIKDDLEQLMKPQWIANACRSIGYQWRQRILGPVETVHLFILQLLEANVSLCAVRRSCGAEFTAAALCKAKARLPLGLLRELNDALCQRVGELGRQWRWHERRAVGIDASTVTLADTPELQSYFGIPSGQKAGCSFPIAKMLTLFDLGTGMVLRNISFPFRRQEICLGARILKWLLPGDVLVADKAFKSFTWFHLLKQASIDLCARLQKDLIVHGRGSGRRRKIKSLGRNDMLVRWERPLNRSPWISLGRWKKLPQFIIMRQITFSMHRQGYRVKKITMLTTLLDPRKYPAKEVGELYLRRWKVEVYQPDYPSSASFYQLAA